jgi:hypothetical protein
MVGLAARHCGVDDRLPLRQMLDAIIDRAADCRLEPGLYAVAWRLATAGGTVH